MKNITSCLLTGMTIVQLFLLASCSDDTEQDQATGLTLKAYSPTVVMKGGEMTITGSNLNEVNTVVFPGDIKVNDFELVTQHQIKVIIPEGIEKDGGLLKLLSETQTKESTVPMRLANPALKVLYPGDEVKVGQELTFKGMDLEYTRQVIFPGQTEDQPIIIETIDFIRKASESVVVKVPQGVKNGKSSLTLMAIDGTVTVSDEIELIAESSGTNILWQGEFVIGGWDQTLDVGADYFRQIQIGNKIRFYFTKNEAEGWWQIKVCDSNWSGFPGLDATGLENYPEGYADLVITQEVYDRIMAEGLHVQGANFMLTKIELIPEVSTGALWEGEFTIENWSPTLDVGLSYFQNIAVNNTLRFYFTPNLNEGWWQIKVCDSTWAGFPGLDATGLENYPEGYADLVITQEVYDRIMVDGLHVQGANFTLIKIELL